MVHEWASAEAFPQLAMGIPWYRGRSSVSCQPQIIAASDPLRQLQCCGLDFFFQYLILQRLRGSLRMHDGERALYAFKIHEVIIICCIRHAGRSRSYYIHPYGCASETCPYLWRIPLWVHSIHPYSSHAENSR